VRWVDRREREVSKNLEEGSRLLFQGGIREFPEEILKNHEKFGQNI
jgi:hypothetical protein